MAIKHLKLGLGNCSTTDRCLCLFAFATTKRQGAWECRRGTVSN